MNIGIIVSVNLLLSVVLFFLNGFLGKVQMNRPGIFDYDVFSFDRTDSTGFSGYFFHEVINPTIYMAIICSIAQATSYIEIACCGWIIVPLYWCIWIIYVISKNRLSIIKWKSDVFAIVLSLGLSEGVFFALIRPLLSSSESVFIELEQLRDAIWFAIIGYIAKVVWDIAKKMYSEHGTYTSTNMEHIVLGRYKKIQCKHGDCIRNNIVSLFETNRGRKDFTCLVYAIIIYEDFCRPPFFRFCERILWRIVPRIEMTLGIMQVRTRINISDRESIALGIKKLYRAYTKGGYFDICSTINDYNPGERYQTEVFSIYRHLKKMVEYGTVGWKSI